MKSNSRKYTHCKRSSRIELFHKPILPSMKEPFKKETIKLKSLTEFYRKRMCRLIRLVKVIANCSNWKAALGLKPKTISNNRNEINNVKLLNTNRRYWN